MGLFRMFLTSEEGNSLTEYALLVALIAVALIPALASLGCSLNWSFYRAGWALRRAATRG
jgi:Flp pilus assembly pilin Flp